MSAAAIVLPLVWATAAVAARPVRQPQPPSQPSQPISPEVAFYRKYTEGLLNRYVRMSMEAGKVPSLLGQDMFRGRVTSYRVNSFEDVVIFLHDIESCLARLDPEQQLMISRVALQQYTFAEAAALMHIRPRTLVRRYGQAIDRLTRLLIKADLLHLQRFCQGEEH